MRPLLATSAKPGRVVTPAPPETCSIAFAQDASRAAAVVLAPSAEGRITVTETAGTDNGPSPPAGDPAAEAAQQAPGAAACCTPATPAAPAAAQPAQTVAQRQFGDINPKFAELTDQVLFGDIWERPGLSKRDRSLVTVSALVAMNRPDQMRGHLQRARDNGLTEAELIEAITHLAFYAGWPSAVTASNVAKEVFQNK